MIDEKVLLSWLKNKSIEYGFTALRSNDDELYQLKAKIDLIGEIINEFKLHDPVPQK